VIQDDLESGLAQFAENSFDFVILSQTLQAMHNVEGVMREMLRVGREGIVTFPNFGYWRHRLDVFGGHMPLSKTLPHTWYDTPNIHLCTVKDFEDLCRKLGAVILDERVIHEGRHGQLHAEPVRLAWGIPLQGEIIGVRLQLSYISCVAINSIGV
jgi:methionine biosynthesis protein MetW